MKKYIAKKEINKELNGIELYFDVYPLAGTKETLKKYGFKWNRKKSCWYAKNTAERDSIADIISETTTAEYKQIAAGTGEEVQEIKKESTKETKKKQAEAKETTQDIINLDNLGANAPSLCNGAELAAAIREDLKKRGVSGVTVRAKKITHETGITVTIKATSADIASVEEYKNRFSFGHFMCKADRGIYNGIEWIYNLGDLTEDEQKNHYNKFVNYELSRVNSFSTHWNERKNCPELTTAFYNKCLAVFKIANQWNYNKSDSMTDYFDIGYFLDIDIKKPDDFIPRQEMTPEEKTAYNEEIKREEEETQKRIEEYRKEQEEAKKQYEAYEAKRKIDREQINKNITVEDLTENNYIYVSNLVGGCGKECNMEELNEATAASPYLNDAIITRKVIFANREDFDVFTNYLLDDFDFLKGMGGTGTADIRIKSFEDEYFKMNKDQRETLKLFCVNCVGFYVDGELLLVSNPEGYSYSRYTYKPTEETQTTSAKEETEKQEAESKEKAPFYFPAAIDEQVKNISIGQKITVYQSDGWNLCNIYGGFGEVVKIEGGNYAQYTGVYITLKNGRSEKIVFLRDGKKCLVYEGIKPLLPDSITKRYISKNMYEVLNNDLLYPIILDYYNEKPLIDTIQR